MLPRAQMKTGEQHLKQDLKERLYSTNCRLCNRPRQFTLDGRDEGKRDEWSSKWGNCCVNSDLHKLVLHSHKSSMLLVCLQLMHKKKKIIRYIEIHFNRRNLPLFYIFISHLSASPLKLGFRVSAFNNLHKFCALTIYAEQTSSLQTSQELRMLSR